MATKTRRPKLKKKSGRRIVSELLERSRCKCGAFATITKAVQTKSGTKWRGFCDDCR